MNGKIPDYINKFFTKYQETDFIIGTDSFDDIELNDSNNENGFWYFKNRKKKEDKRYLQFRKS